MCKDYDQEKKLLGLRSRYQGSDRMGGGTEHLTHCDTVPGKNSREYCMGPSHVQLAQAAAFDRDLTNASYPSVVKQALTWDVEISVSR